MSDFDDVLERLLNDPGFKAALAADPQRALFGYRLDPEERELLGVQFVAGEGGERTVEIRTNKSGVVGLVGPVAAALGVAVSGASNATAGASVGGATPTGSQAFGAAPGTSSFGHVAQQGVETFGFHDPSTEGTESLGSVGGETSGAGSGTQSFGAASGDGVSFGNAPAEATEYRTRVDVDGDGSWDPHTVYERPDGGVDIVADIDNDGRVDFVGHDDDRDGLVDSADFDSDGDGVLDTRMHDDTGDGWMDRQEHLS
jgi:hypothetical protein